MNTLLWIIVALVIIGVIWYVMKKKKGSGLPKKPDEPTPPSTPPSPPEAPGL